jgi:CubicO group peptidase (beta-lactamase class C family)
VSKSWNRIETWLALAVLAVGGVIAAIFGLHAYVTATAVPMHPDPGRVPSEARTPPAPTWQGAIDRGRQAIRAGVTEQNLPGVSVAVGIDGAIVWAEGFGWADLETRAPVTPDTPFRIGTASTVLTSAAVGLLLEQGRFELDKEIQAYVPEYPKKQWPVTLRQVLGHTAGIGTDGGDEGPLYGEHCERPVEALAHFGDDALRFEPGTRYRYSSYGWILVSAAIESAGNEPFLRTMRERVFEPLGMKDTRADVAPGETSGRATPYFPRYAADPRYGPDPMRPVDYSCYAGASIFVSTPSDLVRFGMAVTSGTLLEPQTVQLLQTSQRLPSGEATGYGLGWDLETVTLAWQVTTVVGHDGYSLGWMLASQMIVRERRLVVAVTSNTSYADTAALALKVAEAFAGGAAAAAAPASR